MLSFKEYISEKRTTFTVVAYDPVYGYMEGSEGDIVGLENPKTKEEINRLLSKSSSLKFIANKTDNSLYMWNGINALHGQIAHGLGLTAKDKTVRGDVVRDRGKYIFYLNRPFNKNADMLFSIKATKALEEMLEEMKNNNQLELKEYW